MDILFGEIPGNDPSGHFIRSGNVNHMNFSDDFFRYAKHLGTCQFQPSIGIQRWARSNNDDTRESKMPIDSGPPQCRHLRSASVPIA
jgi:hypothetical protein